MTERFLFPCSFTTGIRPTMDAVDPYASLHECETISTGRRGLRALSLQRRYRLCKFALLREGVPKLGQFDGSIHEISSNIDNHVPRFSSQSTCVQPATTAVCVARV